MHPKKTIRSLAQLPTVPATIDTMAWNQTGSWRYFTPSPANKMPPCQSQCPAGMPVPEIINALLKGEDNAARAAIYRQNPLPGLTSRLCYHPCQTKCIRRELDQNIAIQQIERYLAEEALDQPPSVADSLAGPVAIIGAGPVGLACAYFLKLYGVEAVLMDTKSRAGGDLLSIPPDKLNPQIVATEIERLVRQSDLDLRLGQTLSAREMAVWTEPYQMAVIDPTSQGTLTGPMDPLPPLDPFEKAALTDQVYQLTLPPNLLPFKPAMIAHYIGAGHMAAKGIAHSLSGSPSPKLRLVEIDGKVLRDQIRLEYFEAGEPGSRKFGKQQNIWPRAQVMEEAGRCLSCGTCNQCGQCVLFCPDASIRTNATGVSVDLFHCKGCGVCAYECPRGVITMEGDNE